MNEMVERVARSIANRGFDGCEATDGGGSIAACIGPCGCRELARAVITAMRDPTEAMLDAARHRPDADDDNARFYAGIWRAMIDAALKE